MKVIGTRKQKALELVDRVTRGPAFLTDVVTSPDSPFTVDAIADYKIWVTTWIVPSLHELIPELRAIQKAKAAKAAQADAPVVTTPEMAAKADAIIKALTRSSPPRITLVPEEHHESMTTPGMASKADEVIKTLPRHRPGSPKRHE